MYERAASVVSFILSGRRLTLRLLHQQAATADMEAVSFCNRAGDHDLQNGERWEKGGSNRNGECAVIRPPLIESTPWDTNAQYNLMLT